MSFLTADQVERLTENGRTRNSLKGTGKAVDVEPAARGLTYPRLLDATGRCPPEDVGGP